MDRPELAPELRRFIVTNIPSVPYLEAVLLLRGETQQRWNAEAMSRRLYVGERDAAALLDTAVAAGVAARETVANESTYRFQPATDELRDILDRLAQHYASDVVSVATLIHKRGGRRAQQFADAFRWKSGKDS